VKRLSPLSALSPLSTTVTTATTVTTVTVTHHCYTTVTIVTTATHCHRRHNCHHTTVTAVTTATTVTLPPLSPYQTQLSMKHLESCTMLSHESRTVQKNRKRNRREQKFYKKEPHAHKFLSAHLLPKAHEDLTTVANESFMFVLCFGLHKVWFNRSAETVWVHEEKFF
jgi:hypothetical protein